MWAIFDPMGWTGHGETCPLAAGIHLSLYYGSTTSLMSCLLLDSLQDLPPCFCHLGPSLIPLPGPFAGTMGGGLVVPHSHLGMLVLFPCVPSLFTLGLTFNPFKERSTDKCYVFPEPHNLESWPPQFGHITVPRRWKGSKLQRAQLLKGLTTSAQKFFNCRCPYVPVPHIIAVTDVSQGVSIL